VSRSTQNGRVWTLDGADGQLLIKTETDGRAARLGHRLTLKMNSWRAVVDWTGDRPSSVELDVDVDSLEILRGEGGLTPLTGPEKVLARSNALKTLEADRFRTISFRADDVEQTSDGYRLAGTLGIRGVSRPQTVDLRVDDLADSWKLTCEARVRQSQFKIKPYSMFMGAMKVADDVTVTFAASRLKDS
jgi:polyisoprenoid-binding protein YceI